MIVGLNNMKEISESSKVMVLFGVLTIFINNLKDLELKHGAKRWINILHKQATQMWKELLFQCNRQGDYAEFAFDEMEAYMYEVNKKALDVPMDRMQEYLEYLNNWK
jgi:hypothetical protein